MAPEGPDWKTTARKSMTYNFKRRAAYSLMCREQRIEGIDFFSYLKFLWGNKTMY